METRDIMVANTKTQQRYKIQTNATTLAELKRDLAANNIDYSGMSFTEGIANVQLNEDNSLLPSNLNYKGHITNNLVILLTNTTKNIDSGADGTRQEAYALLKADKALQEAVKQTFGRNYTQVSTNDLWSIISDSQSTVSTAEEHQESDIDEMGSEVINAYTEKLNSKEHQENMATEAVLHLVTLLYKHDIITEEGMDRILSALKADME